MAGPCRSTNWAGWCKSGQRVEMCSITEGGGGSSGMLPLRVADDSSSVPYSGVRPPRTPGRVSRRMAVVAVRLNRWIAALTWRDVRMAPLVLINAVGLTQRLLPHAARLRERAVSGWVRPLAEVVPAVTCTAQASMLTGGSPEQ